MDQDDLFNGMEPCSHACPLCGGELFGTKEYTIEASIEPLMMERGPIGYTRTHGGDQVDVTWFCQNGCEVRCKGSAVNLPVYREPEKKLKPKRPKRKPAGASLNVDKPPLTDEEREKVGNELQRGKEALDEILDGE